MTSKWSITWANKLTAAQKYSWNGPVHAKLTTSFFTNRLYWKPVLFSVLGGTLRYTQHKSICFTVCFIFCFVRFTAQFIFLTYFYAWPQWQTNPEFILLTAGFCSQFWLYLHPTYLWKPSALYVVYWGQSKMVEAQKQRGVDGLCCEQHVFVKQVRQKNVRTDGTFK